MTDENENEIADEKLVFSADDTPKGDKNNLIFVDTDIVLDLLIERQPFHAFAVLLFTLSEMEKFTLCITPLVVSNAFYILRKSLGNEKAKETLRKLKLITKVIDSNEKAVEKALNSSFSDLEDAIQYYTAAENKIEVILTRNLRDYKNANLVIQTPEEYLVTHRWC